MADHVIANAEAIRTMLVDGEGIPADRVSVIHNGLDLPRFDARRREGLKAPLPDTGGAPVVVHVANMNHPVKRQEDLLRGARPGEPPRRSRCTPTSWAMARAAASWSSWRGRWA